MKPQFKFPHKCKAKSCTTKSYFRFDIGAITRIGLYGRCRLCNTPLKIFTSINERGSVVDVVLNVGESRTIGEAEFKFTKEEADEHC